MKTLFCPRCHHQVRSSFDLSKVKLGPEAKIRIKCGNCGKGEVLIRASKETREGVEQRGG